MAAADGRTGERTSERTSERTGERTSERTGECTGERTGERTGEHTSERTGGRAGGHTGERTGERIVELIEGIEKFEMYARGSCKTMQLYGFDVTYSEAAAEIVRAATTARHRAAGYWGLARCMADRETDEDGQTTTSLLLKSISLDPEYYLSYYSLGAFMGATDPPIRVEGGELTQKDLYLKALYYAPAFSMGYNNLAVISTPDKFPIEVPYRDSPPRTFENQIEVYACAILCDKYNSLAYCNLGAILESSSTACIMDYDGRVRPLDRIELYRLSIAYDPTNATAYRNLGVGIPKGSTVQLYDGRTLSRTQLLIESLRYADDSAAIIDLRRYITGTLPSAQPWSRLDHPLIWGGATDWVFGIYLLSVQRLGTNFGHPQPHASMLEDALTHWTWGDHRRAAEIERSN